MSHIIIASEISQRLPQPSTIHVDFLLTYPEIEPSSNPVSKCQRTVTGSNQNLPGDILYSNHWYATISILSS